MSMLTYNTRIQTKSIEKPKFFEKPKEGIIDSSVKNGDYQKINSGAVKTVYKRVIIGRNGGFILDPHQVLYTASSISGRRELTSEVLITQRIDNALITGNHLKKGEESHIQTSMQVTDDEMGVIAPAAIGSLEDYNLVPRLSLATRFSIGFQILKGMHNMQKSGYVTGDAKLENILVFEENGALIVRISDFGKARPLAEGQVSLVDGNPRFTAPEGVLTREGEVFSTGLMILRTLEEGLNRKLATQHEVAVLKPGIDPEEATGKDFLKRRGIEGLLIEHGRKNKKGVSGQLGYLAYYLKAKTSNFVGDLDNARREESLIHDYISLVFKDLYTTLQEKIKSTTLPEKEISSAKIQLQGVVEMVQLLKDMTKANPKERLSMKDAEIRYAKAMELCLSETAFDTEVYI